MKLISSQTVLKTLLERGFEARMISNQLIEVAGQNEVKMTELDNVIRWYSQGNDIDAILREIQLE